MAIRRLYLPTYLPIYTLLCVTVYNMKVGQNIKEKKLIYTMHLAEFDRKDYLTIFDNR